MYKTLHKTLYKTDICHCIYRAAVYKIKQDNQLNAHAFPPLCLYFWKQGVAGDAHHDQNDIGDNVDNDDEEGEMLYNCVGVGKTMDGPKRGLSLQSAPASNQPNPTAQRLSYWTIPDFILPFNQTMSFGLTNLH